MQNPNDVFTLKLTAAIAIDGEIATAGEVVELSRKEAQNILGRGLGELHGEQKLEGEDGVDLSKLKKPQLVELANGLEIEGAEGMSVAELREAIEAKQAA